MGGYLTVLNKYTKRAVPFVIMPNGEIKITSTDPRNDEDTCIVTVINVFHEFSIDFGRIVKKL